MHRVKVYKVSARFIKSVRETVYSIGFSVGEAEKGNLSLSSISEKIGAKIVNLIGLICHHQKAYSTIPQTPDYLLEI